jgi:hypothetical protein
LVDGVLISTIVEVVVLVNTDFKKVLVLESLVELVLRCNWDFLKLTVLASTISRFSSLWVLTDDKLVSVVVKLEHGSLSSRGDQKSKDFALSLHE